MSDRVLNASRLLKQRGKDDYSIHSKPRIFNLFWSRTWRHNIQANEKLTKFKEK